MSTIWRIGLIATPRLHWGSPQNGQSRRCPTCKVVLLTGERPGFCCGPRGNRHDTVERLPPLPDEFNVFLNSPDVSALSRKLNLIFSFASMESTHTFPTPGNPSFVTVAGRVYHRVRSRPQDDTAVRWMLYDGFEDASIPHRTYARDIPSSWIQAVRTSLSRYNPFASAVISLGRLRDASPNQFASASIILQDSGSAEIAAVMCYENTLRSQISPRNLLISTADNRPQTIPTVSRLWEPMAYPLLFPHGTLGWGLRPSVRDPFTITLDGANSDAPTTQIWYYRIRLLCNTRFEIFGRLTNEYIVDMFSRELDSRLTYIRTNQEQLRAQEQDAALMGYEDIQDSENVYLPASFLGSARWSSNQIADSLTIAATFGPPTFFVTFTCNGDWPEIRSRLRPGQTYTDIPVVVCRVFKQKLSRLMSTFRTMFPNAGQLLYSIQRVEFQKRGLPHAHILLKYSSDCITPDDINQVISATIPEAADDAEVVRRFMIHPAHGSNIINNVPPSPEHPLRYCERWKNNARVCRFGYPKSPQDQTTFDPSNRVLYRRGQGDSFVVPYCLPLLRKFQSHINMEIAGTGQLFQYLFKYIHKGPDRAKFRIQTENSGASPIDEIEEYWSGRYLASTEGAWRILGYSITQKTPSVTALSVHLPHSIHHQRYQRSNPSPTLSHLEHYFVRPEGTYLNGTDQRQFKDLCYAEYFVRFRLQKFDVKNMGKPGYFLERENDQGAPVMHVIQRNPSRPHLSRLQSIHISRGELFYLRMLLLSRPGMNWTDLRTIDGTVYSSFQAASIALGLFADHNEAQWCMQEAVGTLRTPHQLRILFVHLLTNSCTDTPLQLWNEFRDKISEDFILDAVGDVERGYNETLKALGSFLQGHGRNLGEYGLPQPVADDNEVERELRRWSLQATALQERVRRGLLLFNVEQRDIFRQVQYAIVTNEPLQMFVDGKAGRGKTFLVDTLCAWVRSTGRIALPTATSGFAAQLYPGGKTTHSTFGVPVNEHNEFLESAIEPHQQRGELLRRSDLIIWDEAPMANRAVLACVEECCRKVMKNQNPFGGKVIILLGDFRQTCPVVPRGTKMDILNACISKSPLWPLFRIFRLTTPIRNADDPEFASFVDSIGDGAGPRVNLSHFVAHTTNINEIVSFVYDQKTLSDPIACLRRCILAPTNAQVDAYNNIVLNLLSSSSRHYHAADSLEEYTDVTEATLPLDPDSDSPLPNPDAVLDYVRRRRPNGMPDYILTVKVGGVYRLLRNLSIDLGLVKNARVEIVGMGSKIITVRLLRNIQAPLIIPSDILLPRVIFKDRLPSGHTLCRRQFPLAPAYASTFHSCQGLTLDRVGIDLTQEVFTHGQLYTALSRVKHRSDTIVRFPVQDDLSTANITYKELLI